MSYADHVARDARLVILRLLHADTSGTGNEVLLQAGLRTFGHDRTRDFVRTQMRTLADLGALRVTEAGSVLVASITSLGIDHVERRAHIEGVERPSPGV
jgi:hypothetical protein